VAGSSNAPPWPPWSDRAVRYRSSYLKSLRGRRAHIGFPEDRPSGQPAITPPPRRGPSRLLSGCSGYLGTRRTPRAHGRRLPWSRRPTLEPNLNYVGRGPGSDPRQAENGVPRSDFASRTARSPQRRAQAHGKNSEGRRGVHGGVSSPFPSA
jgi:hypothetical protein